MSKKFNAALATRNFWNSFKFADRQYISYTDGSGSSEPRTSFANSKLKVSHYEDGHNETIWNGTTDIGGTSMYFSATYGNELNKNGDSRSKISVILSPLPLPIVGAK
jgi:hypothetical protein